MRRIFKYETVFMFDHINIPMPLGAKILSIQEQNNCIAIWAEVDDTAPNVPREFRLIQTGEEPPPIGNYLGTVLLYGASLVFHIYDMP